MFNEVKIVLTDGAKMPKYMTDGACCVDLCAVIPQPVSIPPRHRRTFNTGLKIQIPVGYEGQVRPRSGLTANSVDSMFGTIDSDFRGVMKVILANNGRQGYIVHPGDRIAQLKISKVEQVLFIEVTELDNDTTRGEGGFGSTGR